MAQTAKLQSENSNSNDLIFINLIAAYLLRVKVWPLVIRRRN